MTINISIHAPARGATRKPAVQLREIGISIHAPARGATNDSCKFNQRQRFQSTLPRGERPDALGVTLDQLCNFNPRSREGSDFVATSISAIVFVFQSTLPRGERQTVGFTISRCVSFQSTLPRGERLHSSLSLSKLNYFNPRSREGSDINSTITNFIFCNFNPRSREGSDGNMSVIVGSARLFQSTLPRGERQLH